MKRLALLLALSLPTALACDIKPGFIAHGLMKDTVKMEPICALGDAMKQQIPGSRWVEVWGTTNDTDGKLKVAYVMSVLELRGYKLVSNQPTQKGKVLGYVKGDQRIVLLTAANDPLLFVAIGGK